MKRIMLALALLALIAGAGAAQAACTGAVSAITVLEGGAAVHVTVRDQNCNAVPSAALSVTAGLNGPPCAAGLVGASGTKVTTSQDENTPGLLFAPTAGATGMGTCFVSVTYTDGSNVINAPLSVTLSSGVTSLSLTQP